MNDENGKGPETVVDQGPNEKNNQDFFAGTHFFVQDGGFDPENAHHIFMLSKMNQHLLPNFPEAPAYLLVKLDKVTA
jgi:hypothetical protein